MQLKPGSPAPELVLQLVGGQSWSLADERPEAATMIVVYRGYHCPICADYLSDLHALLPKFTAAGLSVIAVSMDPSDRAEKAKAEWDLPDLKIAYGMSETTALSWGLWLSQSVKENELDVFPEPGLFWIRPDGTLYLIDVATMPFVRPDLDTLAKYANLIETYPVRGTHKTGELLLE
ncbi:MAG: peroxiredoxin-like family protein [Rhizobiaceae bacterium]